MTLTTPSSPHPGLFHHQISLEADETGNTVPTSIYEITNQEPRNQLHATSDVADVCKRHDLSQVQLRVILSLIVTLPLRDFIRPFYCHPE